MRDPNPMVAGRGVRILEEAGIEVFEGILEEEGRKLNEIFLKYITTNLPFVILKTAMTMDGKIATRTGESKWITGEASRSHVHSLRQRVSGIMVGIGTVLADDPALTTRLKDKSGSDPTRIIIDSNARIPIDARVLNLESSKKTIVVVTEKADMGKLKLIEQKGAEIIITPSKNGRVDLKSLMIELGKRKIDSVLLEGGSELNYSCLEEGLVDKVCTYISPKIIGGSAAFTPVGGLGKAHTSEAIKLERATIQRFEEDIMIEAYIKKEA